MNLTECMEYVRNDFWLDGWEKYVLNHREIIFWFVSLFESTFYYFLMINDQILQILTEPK